MSSIAIALEALKKIASHKRAEVPYSIDEDGQRTYDDHDRYYGNYDDAVEFGERCAEHDLGCIAKEALDQLA